MSGAPITVSRVGFRDIADALRQSIQAGEIGPERALPSELELMERYGVARTTVRRALSLLQDESLIEVVQGRGRFVRADGTGPGIARTDKKYEQVAEEIRKLIAAETVPDGTRLGTESELAHRFNVSAGTARRALVMLADEGLLSTVRGQAWFVGDLGEASDRTGAVAASLRLAITEGRDRKSVV